MYAGKTISQVWGFSRAPVSRLRREGLSLWCQSRRDWVLGEAGDSIAAHPPVLAPGSALRSVPTVALSSAQVGNDGTGSIAWEQEQRRKNRENSPGILPKKLVHLFAAITPRVDGFGGVPFPFIP